jgi:hypothetical protein
MLIRQDLTVRASAFSNAPIAEETAFMNTASVGCQSARRPKDPSMPGLSRLTKGQLLFLCQKYLIPDRESAGKTVKELRIMLYNVEPVRPQADYVERVQHASKTSSAKRTEIRWTIED